MYWGMKKLLGAFLITACVASVLSLSEVAEARTLSVLRSNDTETLLFIKNDGSLWGWNGNHSPEALFSNEQFKTFGNSDVQSHKDVKIIKNDGTVWMVDRPCEEKITETQKISTSGKPYISKNREWINCHYTLNSYDFWPGRYPSLNSFSTRWKEVYDHKGFSAGIAVNDELMTWGSLSNQQGQHDATPQKVALEGSFHSAITIGGSRTERGNTCAIRNQDGSVWCLGSNKEFFASSPTDSSQPFRVDLEGKFIQLTTNTESLCALRNDHKLFCWGRNKDNAFGSENSGYFYKTPVTVAGEYSFVDIGWGAFTALDRMGNIKLWRISGFESSPTEVPSMGGFSEILSTNMLNTIKDFHGNTLFIARHGDGSVWYFPKKAGSYSERELKKIENLNLNR